MMIERSGPPIRAFVFDLGGVVVDWDPRNLYRKLFDEREAIEAFLEEIGFADWNYEQDRGRPFAEGVALLSEAFPHHKDLIHAYHERWEESIGGPIHGTVAILRALRSKGYPLGAVTNWSAEKFELVAGKYDFLGWFEPLVVSGKERVCKPEWEIYELLLARSGWAPQACLFIDDSAVNVEAAAELGFQTLHFRSPEQLHGELTRRGVLP